MRMSGDGFAGLVGQVERKSVSCEMMGDGTWNVCKREAVSMQNHNSKPEANEP